MNKKVITKRMLVDGFKFGYQLKNGRIKTFKMSITTYDSGTEIISVRDMGSLIESMNVSKMGPTCLHLYSFDMMGNRTVAKMRYEDMVRVI